MWLVWLYFHLWRKDFLSILIVLYICGNFVLEVTFVHMQFCRLMIIHCITSFFLKWFFVFLTKFLSQFTVFFPKVRYIYINTYWYVTQCYVKYDQFYKCFCTMHLRWSPVFFCQELEQTVFTYLKMNCGKVWSFVKVGNNSCLFLFLWWTVIITK